MPTRMCAHQRSLFLPTLFPILRSLYAYGVLDEGYRWDLTVDEAVELGQRSIYHATFRDAASGGTVSGERGAGVVLRIVCGRAGPSSTAA